MNRIYLPVIGTAFEGEFRDGTFHGHGSTYWPGGQRIDGVWAKGECKDKRYAFDDGLIYVNTDWRYCQFPDRRFVRRATENNRTFFFSDRLSFV